MVDGWRSQVHAADHGRFAMWLSQRSGDVSPNRPNSCRRRANLAEYGPNFDESAARAVEFGRCRARLDQICGDDPHWPNSGIDRIWPDIDRGLTRLRPNMANLRPDSSSFDQLWAGVDAHFAELGHIQGQSWPTSAKLGPETSESGSMSSDVAHSNSWPISATLGSESKRVKRKRKRKVDRTWADVTRLWHAS